MDPFTHSEGLSQRPIHIHPFQIAVETSRPVSGSLTKEQKELASGLKDSKIKQLIPENAVFVSKKLYSGFLEHVGRCIYGGIVNDPEQTCSDDLLLPLPNTSVDWHKDRLKVRKDVFEELSIELGIEAKEWYTLSKDQQALRPLLRWPGGNYVSNYHWQDGIGPIHKRPQRIELAWHGTESNTFGTDEYIEYCRKLGVEPYICLNMGTGTLEEALAWLEYCNGTGNTYWANLRRANTGKEEPHNVQYWGLGNELWGEWQVGRMNAVEYTRTAQRWAHALKLVDPTIKLVSCGKEGGCEWDWTVLQGLNGLVDLHSIHYYTMLGHQNHIRSDEKDNLGSYEKNVFGAAAAEQYITTCVKLIDMAQMEAYNAIPMEKLRDMVNKMYPAPIGICMDEWNVWDDRKATPQRGLEQVYDYTDMLGTVAWLHVLVRNTARMPIACLAQSVNVLSPLLTNSTSTLRQGTYYPVSLFAKYMCDGYLLQVPSLPDIYTGLTFPVWSQEIARPAYVDLVAILLPGKGAIHLSILNRHPTATWQAPLQILAEEFEIENIEVYSIFNKDLQATNTFEKPDAIIPKQQTIDAQTWHDTKGLIPVKPHSWSLVLLRGELAS
ncbi:glycoside hydrolase [Meira miltonrushii]|uniref:non-reducing end alpha-L-arabinofuranosidase n=1 Tax=Meira miltonrushii TaxID=1280837 RepID=A0A316V2A3_9BASI|nr:glycoside hydrolase [Meira miltonrushii]PWN31687.1 glycoside hydrolase [Meira miltonrushii]